ncbi:hypothetical protein NPIL_238951 [Nephila pilipes]|uniref:Uncharacterized protein n=1 Tax=Nephila pilipes TaxID=299642 RepID=A0A8X6TBG4_NEPPI|nr:hypothetical protein NPIL_238951 [Nephila pilipes]
MSGRRFHKQNEKMSSPERARAIEELNVLLEKYRYKSKKYQSCVSQCSALWKLSSRWSLTSRFLRECPPSKLRSILWVRLVRFKNAQRQELSGPKYEYWVDIWQSCQPGKSQKLVVEQQSQRNSKNE